MSNPDIDKTLTQQLLCASIQTYTAFNAGSAFPGSDPLSIIKNPEGLTYKESFSGQDTFDKGLNQEVLFGLIFAVDAEPGSYVFAFRGTKGISEWIDDLKVAKTKFVPLKPNSKNPLPDKAFVEDGFWEIYKSMQKELFRNVETLGVEKLYITGHSLGSSLAELFTFEVAYDGEIPFYSSNFACPRTGNDVWAKYYDSLTKGEGNPTIRVVNTEDLVPKVPPKIMGFAHVGEAYDICFKSDDFRILPNYGLRHSADNYARTLAHVFGTSVECQLESSKLDDLKYC